MYVVSPALVRMANREATLYLIPRQYPLQNRIALEDSNTSFLDLSTALARSEQQRSNPVLQNPGNVQL